MDGTTGGSTPSDFAPAFKAAPASAAPKSSSGAPVQTPPAATSSGDASADFDALLNGTTGKK
jgi:hypothetical protein